MSNDSKTKSLEIMSQFNIDNLPDLSTTVLASLELFSLVENSKWKISLNKPLVIGSGNAYITGKLLFKDSQAVFANESSYKSMLKLWGEYIDGVVVVSASGSKHSIEIVQYCLDNGYETNLLTSTANSPAVNELDSKTVTIFPKNREPYTYNTSTYMGMLLSKHPEDTNKIKSFIEHKISNKVFRDLNTYESFTFILPSELAELKEMFRTKFDELFGPLVTARFFTNQEIKHAKTVVPSGSELFVSFGAPNNNFGLPKNRLTLPLPTENTLLSALAIGYYFIGQIQKAKPPYFKDNLEAYTQEASRIFNQDIEPIVES